MRPTKFELMRKNRARAVQKESIRRRLEELRQMGAASMGAAARAVLEEQYLPHRDRHDWGMGAR